MSPDLDLRFNTMMAALTDIIIPAIDPNNALAKEQAALLLGSISMIRGQVDYSHAYETIDARALVALAGQLKALIGQEATDADRTISVTRQALTGMQATSTLRNANRDLREAIRLLIDRAESAGSSVAKPARRAVLDHTAETIARERAWVAGTGFEDRKTLASIPASLGLLDD